MIKLFLGRVLPLGMCGALLQSSYSPIRPALNAFSAATAALAGESVSDSDAHFAGTEGQPPLSIPTTPDAAARDAKRSMTGALGGLFGGKSNRDVAAQQLDAVIADVKYHGHPPENLPPPPMPTDRAPHPLAPPPKGEVKLTRVKGSKEK